MSEQRPDPDVLLEKVQEEERRASRGRLKIFFGASAGVGKTYAMLSAARSLRERGVDAVAGVVETHGRKETQALLAGLEILPLKPVEYRGRTLSEFDLDAALARRPAVMLVDELAHTNAPGSRHPKRWQDVIELLDAGVDVFTTLNVQHLETLNDVVGSITGVRVRETLPDHVFDAAAEVILVDLPPDELLDRLKAGKVYVPEQIRRAADNFFRKGNLIALRELALRRTADRVDEQMREYREDQAIRGTWQAREKLLVAIGPGPGMEKLVRSASRLASRLDADWHAAYVETPRLARLPGAERERILRVLRLAQELGADTAALAGQDVGVTLAEYAARRNVARVLIGRAPRQRLRWLRPTVRAHLARHAQDVEILEIPLDAEGEAAPAEKSAAEQEPARLMPYVWTAVAVGLTTLATVPLVGLLDQANIVMLFLLVVVMIGWRFGRGPAAAAAVLSVAAFDFFCVPPRLSFAVSDVQYLLTFGVMLVTGLVIGRLTARLSYQARVSGVREERARSLFELGRDLSGALLAEQVVQICEQRVGALFGARVKVLLPDQNDQLQPPSAAEPAIDMGIARWVFDRGQPAGFGTDTLPGSAIRYLPLKAPMRTRGVLAVEPSHPRPLLVPEQQQLLDTHAALVAIALERVHYVEVAQRALVTMEAERLRNSLLSALSHDLRTPVTALVGLADSLAMAQPPPEAKQELARAIRDEALRMAALVHNILDMARLQSGEVRLNKQWHALEEIVGSAIKSRERLLAGRPLQVRLPPDFPLLELDAVLIERVLCNLLENAAKYTPAGTPITVEAAIVGDKAQVAVGDRGPGLPAGMQERVFERFTRGQRESPTAGVGLGLSICRAIVEAHGGRIWAEDNPGGGARFVFTLPASTPPTVEEPDPPPLAEGAAQ